MPPYFSTSQFVSNKHLLRNDASYHSWAPSKDFAIDLLKSNVSNAKIDVALIVRILAGIDNYCIIDHSGDCISKCKPGQLLMGWLDQAQSLNAQDDQAGESIWIGWFFVCFLTQLRDVSAMNEWDHDSTSLGQNELRTDSAGPTPGRAWRSTFIKSNNFWAYCCGWWARTYWINSLLP